MTYDPFQNNAALGAYTGAGNPFYSPLTAMQTSAITPSFVNPSLVNQGAPWNPMTGYQGIPQSIWPQSISAGQVGYAQPGLLQNPLLQNPLMFAGHHGGVHNGITHNPYAQQLAIQQQLAVQQLVQQIVAQQQAQQAVAQQLAALSQPQGFYGQTGQIGITGQQGVPFGQNVSPFTQLAPQSWVGQAGQQGGQANAVLLAQLTARALQAQGLNPGLAPGISFPV
jgi:hypothetical protein